MASLALEKLGIPIMPRHEVVPLPRILPTEAKEVPEDTPTGDIDIFADTYVPPWHATSEKLLTGASHLIAPFHVREVGLAKSHLRRHGAILIDTAVNLTAGLVALQHGVEGASMKAGYEALFAAPWAKDKALGAYHRLRALVPRRAPRNPIVA